MRTCGILNSRHTVKRPDVNQFRMNVREAKIIPLLGKGGVAAPSRKMVRRHLIGRGRGGSFNQQIIFLANTTPSAPSKVASRHFLDGAATPPQLWRGVRC